jgi:hypothetical protein
MRSAAIIGSNGREYEQSLALSKPKVRKANGIYYTPGAIVEHVIEHTLGRWLQKKTPDQAAKITILDPACGCGAFLVSAYQYLLNWHRDWYVDDGSHKHTRKLCRDSAGAWQVRPSTKRQILLNSIYGVDLDLEAVRLTRRSLLTLASGGVFPRRPTRGDKAGGSLKKVSLDNNIRCGNALIGPDFPGRPSTRFDWADILSPDRFTIVLGNPPWGQKEIAKDEALKRYLWQRFPSSAGIFDLFRPFVELGVRLTAPDGYFGMVLPDIVLLKDYPQTRLMLLDELTLDRIDTWGMAFFGALIDAVTIIGQKRSTRRNHRIYVTTDSATKQPHKIPQADFRANPRHTFNLHLTSARRRVIDRLADCPRLGEYFEVHEGVHSGNIRDELFVRARLDDTCRELLFGRDEIGPYRLRWQGRFIRLSAMLERKTQERYANLGRSEWHEREKLLVRRTGDHVLAAVDRHGRYASNNFFLVFPKQSCSLTLDGLCALLNSRFMTWFFRTIEPRQGRVFAELKIKHLTTFPLPMQVLKPNGCAAMNDLGSRRIEDGTLDSAIDDLVREMLGASEAD